ncbi:hypothetical protein AD929_15665 [Gluconobacter potus]|uniref:Uncharacterized protein n=1 Tax=Gluconobacter potus TaxID=2724927 RepID=A0A149QPJ6_9PROT|nr:hypothetical protein [Gluconobacter potus]KXU99232.1 hypothetical protein AD929_15665 [Gluconobacter potus]
MPIPAEITLEDGRKFTLKEVDPGDMLDLIEAAGSAMSGASAGAWLGYAQQIATVSEIDDVPVPFPKTKEEVKALARRLGNSGVVALQKVFMADQEAVSGVEAAKN